MELITGSIRNYDWGSKSLIASLQGRVGPSEKPEAEIWYGAHPVAPSEIGSASLDWIIEKDPLLALGQRVTDRFDGKLPFLLKILAAGAPLSLQAHPSLEEAQIGFERENLIGVNIHARDRNYRDTNHKPELVVALTDFVAMAGFRPISYTLEIFDALNCVLLNKYREDIKAETESEWLKKLFKSWIELPTEPRRALVDSIISSAENYITHGQDEDIKFVFHTVLSFHKNYPDDNGILISLLLNFYKLSPGEGLYVDAGTLHAYVSGLAVEVMANSDNVLRGGFTSKHVDVSELIRILNFEPLKDTRVQIQNKGEIVSYPVPVEDFKLTKIQLHGKVCVEQEGPMIILCTRGKAELSSGDKKLTLDPTGAAWVPSSDDAVFINCDNAEVFVVRA